MMHNMVIICVFRHHIVWFTCLLPRQRDAHGVRDREEAMVLPRSGILVQEEEVRRNVQFNRRDRESNRNVILHHCMQQETKGFGWVCKDRVICAL